MMMNAMTMMTMKMLTTHQHHHPSDKIMITRTKATTSKRDETRTRRQNPNDCTKKSSVLFVSLSLESNRACILLRFVFSFVG